MWCYHCCSFGALLLCAMTLGSVLLTITKLYATFPLLQHLLALKVLHSCAVDHMQSCPVRQHIPAALWLTLPASFHLILTCHMSPFWKPYLCTHANHLILVGMTVLCGKVLSLACTPYNVHTDTCQPTSNASLQAASAAFAWRVESHFCYGV